MILEIIIEPLLNDEAIHPLIKTEMLNHLTARASKTAFKVFQAWCH